MCALQYRRFADVKLAIGTLRVSLAGPAMDSESTTLDALSLVSKHWSKVTEPYRFSVRHLLQHNRFNPIEGPSADDLDSRRRG